MANATLGAPSEEFNSTETKCPGTDLRLK